METANTLVIGFLKIMRLRLIWFFMRSKPRYIILVVNEWQNIDLVKLLCKIMDEKLGREVGASEQLISYVKIRLGHDLRYAIDASKINTG
jgi:dTDP-D-glucose 4,6-dehydratase